MKRFNRPPDYHDSECEANSEACGCDSRAGLVDQLMAAIEKIQELEKRVRVVGVIGLMLLAIGYLSGCGMVGALSYASYAQGQAEGKYPPSSLSRRCTEEGMVKNDRGDWSWNRDLTRQCMAKEGW